MNVLVDTTVWSLALRRNKPGPPELVRELEELILEGRAVIIGPIRQELLSGVRSGYETLRDHLRAFPDLTLETGDYEEAGRFFNRCHAAGVQGSNTDFLICAAAARRGLSILSTDRDFAAFASILSVRLHGRGVGS